MGDSCQVGLGHLDPEMWLQKPLPRQDETGSGWNQWRGGPSLEVGELKQNEEEEVFGDRTSK